MTESEPPAVGLEEPAASPVAAEVAVTRPVGMDSYIALDKQEVSANESLFFEDLADLSKIRKQLQDTQYVKDRTKWSKYVANAECYQVFRDLGQCTTDKFWPRCLAPFFKYQRCKIDAMERFSDEYDNVKIKEFIQMMRDADLQDRVDAERLPGQAKQLNSDVKKNIL